MGGPMEKRFARPRGLLAIVALAITASMCIVSPAHAGSAASLGRLSTVAPRGTAASSAPCNFVLSLTTCESTDPNVTYTSNAHGDTSNCTFVFAVSWGDGGSSTNVQTDPTVGPHLIGTHKYAAPGTYTITVNVQLTAGTCTATNSVHTFTLLPAPGAPSPTIHWSRISGRPGTHVTLTGNGWVPGGTVRVQLPSQRFLYGRSSWKVDSHGGWQQQFTEAGTTPGSYKLSFRESSGNLLVTGNFRVLPVRVSKGVYCLGGSPGQACTGGSTSGGKPTKITVPKVPSELAKTLSPAKLWAAVDFVGNMLKLIAITAQISGETLPSYFVKALTCSGLSGAHLLQCVQNTGFPQAPITKT